MLILLAWSLSAAGAAGEPEAEKAVIPGLSDLREKKQDSEPWIGLEVAQLNEAMRAHLSEVPEGVGFVVTRIEEDGPAAGAGLRKFDILWKFEDQLLINEAQFGTLIRMKAPGDEVSLGIVRGGKSQELAVTIGRMPAARPLTGLNPAEIPIFPSGVPGMPRQVVYPGDRTAEITRQDGSIARLRYEEDVAIVRIEDEEGELIFDGPIRQDGRFAVPEDWRCTVGALLRTIHRSEADASNLRRPRPRVVKPPSVGQSGG